MVASSKNILTSILSSLFYYFSICILLDLISLFDILLNIVSFLNIILIQRRGSGHNGAAGESKD